jgi:hypothetical protein
MDPIEILVDLDISCMEVKNLWLEWTTFLLVLVHIFQLQKCITIFGVQVQARSNRPTLHFLWVGMMSTTKL